ncbi:MAG: Gfo/Idh/MocA family oxidoreductase [Chloroflexi bacterium]|nr:Gfo/Idh/MocA family oxidoreductase [Chloroflexota bacterium]
MKFLIAGFGSIGRRHFRNLLALGERDIVFLRSKRSTLPDAEIAAFPVETDIQAALAHKPDAVIVSNPTSLHLDVALPAAEAGCHIFLEKPISHSMERVDELQAAVQRGGGQVLVGFQFRFHPSLGLIKQWLSGNHAPRSTPHHTPRPTHHSPLPAPPISNLQSLISNPHSPIGRPLSARAHWGEYLPGWHPWEDYRQGYSARADLGGGVILTLCHPLDYLRWLLGDVTGLWAFTGKAGDLELAVEDTAEIGLHFASGVIGSVHLDYNQRPPSHHLEIVGTHGTIRWDNADGAVHIYRASSDEWGIYPLPQGFERNQLFRDQMKHFLAVVGEGEQPVCTLEDGVWALRLALAAHESARKGEVITWAA